MANPLEQPDLPFEPKLPLKPGEPGFMAEEIDLDEEDHRILDEIWDEIGRKNKAKREMAAKLEKIQPGGGLKGLNDASG